jgi:hypothetical protein
MAVGWGGIMSIFRALLILLITFACGAAVRLPAATPLQKKVLIIGIDGTMPSALAVAHTPTLNALRAQGAFSDRAVTDPVTHSAACWSSMFTGVWGDKHGVQDPGNSFAGNKFHLYPSFYTRLEAAHSNWNTAAFARWAPVTNAVPAADLKQAFGSDAAIVTATCAHLTNANPDVFWTILLDVDSAGHSYGWGPTVTNYVKAIETADGRVGQILGALTNRVTYTNEDWLVIVLSDHGKHDSTVEESRITFHLLWGPSAARGTLWPAPSIVDVCATVLTHMGVPIEPSWNLDARLEGLPMTPPAYGTNLLFNGDAEANSGTNGYTPDRGIAWWFDVFSMTLGRYDGSTNFPGAASPGPTHRGLNFFLGGTNATSLLSQRLDLSPFATDLDDPGVDFALSGWFGGVGAQADSASLTVRFLNASNVLLGSQTVGPVTAAERGGVTGLLERSTNGVVPAGTRLAEFTLTAQATNNANDALADNLSFVLAPRADPPPEIVAAGFDEGAWRVEFASRTNRVYELERCERFDAWQAPVASTNGTGARLALSDPAPPPGQAFYRITCRRP